MKKVTAILLAALVAAGALAAIAYAHSGVKSYSPRKNSTVPKAVRVASVTFKGAVRSGQLSVRGPGGTVSRGKGSLVEGKRVLRADLKRGLKRGRYTASWKALHADGHVTRGTWRFRVR